MKISLIINCDTRAGWLEPTTGIKDHGDNSLCGCRSVDFMIEGVKNKLAYFKGYELETIVVIDVRESIPDEINAQLIQMIDDGQINYLRPKPFDHSSSRWNDFLYLESLRLACKDSDYICHFDGDVAAFRRPEFPIIDQYLAWLDEGYKYVCQPTQIHNHGMAHASSRFFICKGETLDFQEIERCLNDYSYFQQRYPNCFAPCLEHFLGALCGGAVLYPFQQNQDYTIFSFVEYQRGLLERLNALPYDEVYRYVFETCGGVHGASDFIPRGMP